METANCNTPKPRPRAIPKNIAWQVKTVNGTDDEELKKCRDRNKQLQDQLEDCQIKQLEDQTIKEEIHSINENSKTCLNLPSTCIPGLSSIGGLCGIIPDKGSDFLGVHIPPPPVYKGDTIISQPTSQNGQLVYPNIHQNLSSLQKALCKCNAEQTQTLTNIILTSSDEWTQTFIQYIDTLHDTTLINHNILINNLKEIYTNTNAIPNILQQLILESNTTNIHHLNIIEQLKNLYKDTNLIQKIFDKLLDIKNAQFSQYQDTYKGIHLVIDQSKLNVQNTAQIVDITDKTYNQITHLNSVNDDNQKHIINIQNSIKENNTDYIPLGEGQYTIESNSVKNGIYDMVIYETYILFKDTNTTINTPGRIVFNRQYTTHVTYTINKTTHNTLINISKATNKIQQEITNNNNTKAINNINDNLQYIKDNLNGGGNIDLSEIYNKLSLLSTRLDNIDNKFQAVKNGFQLIKTNTIFGLHGTNYGTQIQLTPENKPIQDVTLVQQSETITKELDLIISAINAL